MRTHTLARTYAYTYAQERACSVITLSHSLFISIKGDLSLHLKCQKSLYHPSEGRDDSVRDRLKVMLKYRHKSFKVSAFKCSRAPVGSPAFKSSSLRPRTLGSKSAIPRTKSVEAVVPLEHLHIWTSGAKINSSEAASVPKRSAMGPLGHTRTSPSHTSSTALRSQSLNRSVDRKRVARSAYPRSKSRDAAERIPLSADLSDQLGGWLGAHDKSEGSRTSKGAASVNPQRRTSTADSVFVFKGTGKNEGSRTKKGAVSVNPLRRTLAGEPAFVPRGLPSAKSAFVGVSNLAAPPSSSRSPSLERCNSRSREPSGGSTVQEDL